MGMTKVPQVRRFLPGNIHGVEAFIEQTDWHQTFHPARCRPKSMHAVKVSLLYEVLRVRLVHQVPIHTLPTLGTYPRYLP
jgi:hypothetical protein